MSDICIEHIFYTSDSLFKSKVWPRIRSSWQEDLFLHTGIIFFTFLIELTTFLWKCIRAVLMTQDYSVHVQ